jgi:tetratricopeptide (TPR) repeat protein
MNAPVAAALAALMLSTTALRAQTAADHIALGDRDHAAMNVAGALTHYEAAVAADSNDYAALWKAAHEAVDVGEFSPKEQRTALYKRAELLARRAVQVRPDDAEGHYVLSRALGRTAQTLGAREKVKYATAVRQAALEALRLNPKHDGAMHVMGVWNAEIMRLSGFSRMMAKNLLGGKVFEEASWDNAQRFMEQSVAERPDRLTHHLDLARVYRDRDMRDKARASYEAVVNGTASEANDRHYKEVAARELRELD